MAYNRPTTKVVGEDWEDTDWNADVSANFIASFPDVATAKGQIAFGTAADTMTTLSVGGSDYDTLTADSGEASGAKYATFASECRASYNFSGTQVVNSGSVDILDYDNSLYDTDTAVTTGAAWKFTVPASKGGYYLVETNVNIASSANWTAGEHVDIYLYKNGSALPIYPIGVLVAEATATFATNVNGFSVVSLAANDEINIRLTHNTGGGTSLTVQATNTWIAITKIF